MATKIAKLKPAAGTVHWLNECIRRSKAGPFYEITTLTPGLAEVLLSMNDQNRLLIQSRVDRYATDMAEGRWQFNGESILVSDCGRLNDGQHRCAALKQAGICIQVSIGFGFPFESRLTTDQGGAKTAANFARMAGHKNAEIAAGCARLVLAYEDSSGSSIGATSRLTNTQVLLRVQSDPAIARSADFAAGGGKRLPFVSPSVSAFCHYVLSGICEEDADTYMRQVATGEGLKNGDPALTVRNRLIAEGRALKSLKIEIILRGWVSFRKGIPLRRSQTHETLPALV